MPKASSIQSGQETRKLLPISTLSIKGFKSIQALDGFVLGDLNVLIGPNGAGKSNFISFFSMLDELFAQRLQLWTAKQGGADRIVTFGIKETPRLEFNLQIGLNTFTMALEPTASNEFVFAREEYCFDNPSGLVDHLQLGSGHRESKLNTIQSSVPDSNDVGSTHWRWTVFHFHDTGETAGMKRWASSHDDEFLRWDGSNLAAFLYRLSRDFPEIYQMICKTVRLAIPFFADFVFKTRELPTGEEQVWLLWRQKKSDYLLWPGQLSDGSLRFICLVTALLQPAPPSLIVLDEPELGLHPTAIAFLGSLLRSASKRMQVIVATQSVSLVNEFAIDDLIIVDREQGTTRFTRYKEDAFSSWLEEYSVGELWTKNILDERVAS
ncbi:MAG: AAA family ATPase [Magnetococcus sp. YQC-3]